MRRRDSQWKWVEFSSGFIPLRIDIEAVPDKTDEIFLRISAETVSDERLTEAAIDAVKRQLARVVTELEANAMLARQREAEGKRLREPQAKIIVQRKAETRLRAQELRDQVQSDPRNGDLQWQLARQIAGIDLPQVLDDHDPFWRDADFWLPVTPNTEEAYGLVELALSLGITDLVTSARAHYLLIILSISTKVSNIVSGGHATLVDDDMTHRNAAWNFPTQPEAKRMYLEEGPGSKWYVPTKLFLLRKYLEEVPGAKSHCEAILNDTRRHLQRNPRDLMALNLCRETALILGRKDQVDKMEAAIAQVLRLQEAGLASNAGDVSVGPQRDSAHSDGQDLEALMKRLLTAMGLETTATKTTGDGGIDLIAVSESPIFSGTYIVQCKDWTNPVGEPIPLCHNG
jgi:hypothetical protein